MAVPSKTLVGVVVSAGKMQKAVKVRTVKQTYNSFIKKHFQTYKNHLVSDPNSSLRAGDIVRIENEGRKLSRHIQHVVSEIIAPWGPAIEERPPIFTAEERRMIWQEKYNAKVLRRTGRGKREGSREARAAQGAAEEAKVANETEEDHVEGMVEGTQIAS